MNKFGDVLSRFRKSKIFSHFPGTGPGFLGREIRKSRKSKFRKVPISAISKAFELKIFFAPWNLPKGLPVNFEPVWMSLTKIEYAQNRSKATFCCFGLLMGHQPWRPILREKFRRRKFFQSFVKGVFLGVTRAN